MVVGTDVPSTVGLVVGVSWYNIVVVVKSGIEVVRMVGSIVEIAWDSTVIAVTSLVVGVA